MPDTIIVRAINDTGKAASDVHVTLAFSGGKLYVDPSLVQVFGPVTAPDKPPPLIPTPPPAIPTNPPAVSNHADVEWDTAVVPPGGEVRFPVFTDAGPLQITMITWSFPKEAGASMSVPLGAPLHDTAALTHALIEGGVAAGPAAAHAATLGHLFSAVHSAGGPAVLPAPAIHGAVGALVTNTGPLAVAHAAHALNFGLTATPVTLEAFQPTALEIAPVQPGILQPLGPDGGEATVIETIWQVVEALGDVTQLQEGGPPALQQLIGRSAAAAQAFSPALADPMAGELREVYEPFATVLASGVEFAARPETFLMWRDQLVQQASRLARTLRGIEGEAVMAAQPLQALATTLTLLDFTHIEGPWQAATLSALMQMQVQVDLAYYRMVCIGLLPILSRDCPPCKPDCKYPASTTYMSIDYSNPQNCKTHTISIPIPDTGYYWTTWTKTCTWDAHIEYKQVYGCYSNPVYRAIRFPACCSSVREWSADEKQSRQLTVGDGAFTKEFRPDHAPLPDKVHREKVSTSTDAQPNPVPPPDAKKTF